MYEFALHPTWIATSSLKRGKLHEYPLQEHIGLMILERLGFKVDVQCEECIITCICLTGGGQLCYCYRSESLVAQNALSHIPVVQSVKPDFEVSGIHISNPLFLGNCYTHDLVIESQELALGFIQELEDY